MFGRLGLLISFQFTALGVLSMRINGLCRYERMESCISAVRHAVI